MTDLISAEKELDKIISNSKTELSPILRAHYFRSKESIH